MCSGMNHSRAEHGAQRTVRYAEPDPRRITLQLLRPAAVLPQGPGTAGLYYGDRPRPGTVAGRMKCLGRRCLRDLFSMNSFQE